jgi:hypothetical protein
MSCGGLQSGFRGDEIERERLQLLGLFKEQDVVRDPGMV